MSAERIFTSLTDTQANGLACVVCGLVRVTHVPVGRPVQPVWVSRQIEWVISPQYYSDRIIFHSPGCSGQSALIRIHCTYPKIRSDG